eukprot:scaffold73455_cov67-Phaeocystis_antarctica.AAC.11
MALERYALPHTVGLDYPPSSPRQLRCDGGPPRVALGLADIVHARDELLPLLALPLLLEHLGQRLPRLELDGHGQGEAQHGLGHGGRLEEEGVCLGDAALPQQPPHRGECLRVLRCEVSQPSRSELHRERHVHGVAPRVRLHEALHRAGEGAEELLARVGVRVIASAIWLAVMRHEASLADLRLAAGATEARAVVGVPHGEEPRLRKARLQSGLAAARTERCGVSQRGATQRRALVQVEVALAQSLAAVLAGEARVVPRTA